MREQKIYTLYYTTTIVKIAIMITITSKSFQFGGYEHEMRLFTSEVEALTAHSCT